MTVQDFALARSRAVFSLEADANNSCKAERENGECPWLGHCGRVVDADVVNRGKGVMRRAGGYCRRR